MAAMKTYLESVDSEWFSQRIGGVMLVVALAFAALMARLLYLQVIEGREYRRLSEINSIRLQDIDAPRGLVFDRNNHMLVDNRPSFDLHIILKDARPLDETLGKLSRFTGDTVDDLRAIIKKNRHQGAYVPILLKEDIGRDMLAAIEVNRFDLPGLVMRVSPRRHYLFDTHAAHLLGYVGEISAEELRCAPYEDCKGGDYIGKFGVEKAFETLLRGRRGGRQVEVNATGQVVSVLNTVPAEPGTNLTLTIDSNLQRTAEAMLEGEAGAAVAIDPNTGEILAMASSPTFDPNWFVTGMSQDQWQELIHNPFRPLENKAIQAEYPPASTYKIITAMAGLQEGVINSQTVLFCPGYYRFGNRTYRCWKHAGHGEVNVIKAITESCDVFFYQVGEQLGVDVLARYAKAAGLGALTGIGLDREAKGIVPTKSWKRKRLGESWMGGETLSVAIGQGFNLVTPLQLAVMVAAVGNGGYLPTPHLLRRPSEDAEADRSPRRLPVSPENLTLVQEGLWAVVNTRRGTAWGSRLKGVSFSGKTGTAQVVGRTTVEGLDEDQIEMMHRDHAWFVAYAPSENPQIAIAVIVEHGEHGSSAAAPVAAKLIETYLGLGQDDIMVGRAGTDGVPPVAASRTSFDGHSGAGAVEDKP